MPEPDLTRSIECDPSLSRLVIYSYETVPRDAELIEQNINETFEWIKSVWVDCDAYQQVTVNLDVTADFQTQSAIKRYGSLINLIMYVVQAIGWNPARTCLVYSGTIYRLNP